jgi:hypothetical protein
VKESLTAAIVVRSLLAAERSSWLVGVLVGWAVVRRELFWPVVDSVVVAVDIGTCDLLGEWMECAAAQTGGGTAWKSPWLRTVFGHWHARSAAEATMEPSVAMSRNQ